MTVLQVCAFGADHPGNFIASLEALEKALVGKGVRTVYAFVERAAEKEWCKRICERTKVYFLPEAKARILPKTYQIMRKIYAENDVNIVHTHFELYDIPATVTANKKAKIFWHLHDPIVIGTSLRSMLWKFQYSYVGKRATLLSVADYYKDVVISMGFPSNQTATVLNGIDLNRIQKKCYGNEQVYDFLTFGWDFERKGDDLILQACNRLEQEGYRFKLLLNGNEATWSRLKQFLDGREPAYLVRGNPVKDVSQLFDQSRVFVQASRRETFSYAVCEAAYAGLPVICSDISGLEWAYTLPTVNFFQSEDIEDLYTLMKEYLDGKSTSECSVSNSQAFIEEHLSIDAWAQSIVRYYGLEV